MPLYEYLCQHCSTQTELLVNGAQQPQCPSCGSEKLTKLLSVVATPSRGSTGGQQAEMPSAPCGASCACFPQG